MQRRSEADPEVDLCARFLSPFVGWVSLTGSLQMKGVGGCIFRKRGSSGSRPDRKNLMLIAEAVKGKGTHRHTHTHSDHALDTNSHFIATPLSQKFLKFELHHNNSDVCLCYRAAR